MKKVRFLKTRAFWRNHTMRKKTFYDVVMLCIFPIWNTWNTFLLKVAFFPLSLLKPLDFHFSGLSSLRLWRVLLTSQTSAGFMTTPGHSWWEKQMVHVILVAKICLSVFPIFCLFYVIFFSPDLGCNERSLCQWNFSWRECVCVAGQKSPALMWGSKVQYRTIDGKYAHIDETI